MKNNIVIYDGVRITPNAYQKIMYFMYRGDTEVTGFGETDPDDDFLIIDFHLVKQECTAASVTMGEDCKINKNKTGLDDYLNSMIDKGINPNKCFRYWIHTHPGSSPHPSGQDEKQFEEFMANYPWIVMLIFARNKSTYCRLGLTQGPGASVELNVSVDWSVPCEDIDFEALEKEYEENVTTSTFISSNISTNTPINWKRGAWRENSYTGNFTGIDWSERGSMQEIASWDNRHYNYDDDDLDPNTDPMDLFEDIDDILTKDIHSMTDEELEAYEEYCNGEMSKE